MFNSTRRALGVLGASAAVVVAGIGASAGAIGLTGSSGPAPAQLVTGAPVPAESIPVPTTVAEPVVDLSTTVPTTPPTTAVAVKRTPTTKASPVTTVAPPPVTTAPAPAPVVPSVAPLAARTVPTADQVQAAIQGITSLVVLPGYIKVTPSLVAAVGDAVCDSFDQGQTFAQVKTTGLAMVSAYVVVSDAAADYAVRTSVALYCPAYASKLV